MTPDSIPVFLPDAGIGINRGTFSPQIRAIDVFYTDPIVTGFHVVGSPDGPDPINLTFEGHEENFPKVVGFFAMAISDDKCGGPCVEDLVLESSGNLEPAVLGFFGTSCEETCDRIALEVLGESEQAPKVLGFFAKECE